LLPPFNFQKIYILVTYLDAWKERTIQNKQPERDHLVLLDKHYISFVFPFFGSIGESRGVGEVTRSEMDDLLFWIGEQGGKEGEMSGLGVSC
jgi:hypothetical protein